MNSYLNNGGTKPKMSFNKLPIGCWQEIIAHLSLKDIKSLILTCRSCQDIILRNVLEANMPKNIRVIMWLISGVSRANGANSRFSLKPIYGVISFIRYFSRLIPALGDFGESADVTLGTLGQNIEYIFSLAEIAERMLWRYNNESPANIMALRETNSAMIEPGKWRTIIISAKTGQRRDYRGDHSSDYITIEQYINKRGNGSLRRYLINQDGAPKKEQCIFISRSVLAEHNRAKFREVTLRPNLTYSATTALIGQDGHGELVARVMKLFSAVNYSLGLNTYILSRGGENIRHLPANNVFILSRMSISNQYELPRYLDNLFIEIAEPPPVVKIYGVKYIGRLILKFNHGFRFDNPFLAGKNKVAPIIDEIVINIMQLLRQSKQRHILDSLCADWPIFESVKRLHINNLAISELSMNILHNFHGLTKITLIYAKTAKKHDNIYYLPNLRKISFDAISTPIAEWIICCNPTIESAHIFWPAIIIGPDKYSNLGKITFDNINGSAYDERDIRRIDNFILGLLSGGVGASKHAGPNLRHIKYIRILPGILGKMSIWQLMRLIRAGEPSGLKIEILAESLFGVQYDAKYTGFIKQKYYKKSPLNYNAYGKNAAQNIKDLYRFLAFSH